MLEANSQYMSSFYFRLASSWEQPLPHPDRGHQSQLLRLSLLQHSLPYLVHQILTSRCILERMTLKHLSALAVNLVSLKFGMVILDFEKRILMLCREGAEGQSYSEAWFGRCTIVSSRWFVASTCFLWSNELVLVPAAFCWEMSVGLVDSDYFPGNLHNKANLATKLPEQAFPENDVGVSIQSKWSDERPWIVAGDWSNHGFAICGKHIHHTRHGRLSSSRHS